MSCRGIYVKPAHVGRGCCVVEPFVFHMHPLLPVCGWLYKCSWGISNVPEGCVLGLNVFVVESKTTISTRNNSEIDLFLDVCVFALFLKICVVKRYWMAYSCFVVASFAKGSIKWLCFEPETMSWGHYICLYGFISPVPILVETSRSERTDLFQTIVLSLVVFVVWIATSSGE